MSKNYNTRTASLKATIADIRTLDAKKLSLNGKNILDYISDSEFNGYDTRDPQLKNDELDIWNTEISISDNGHIEVKPLEHSSFNHEQITTITSAIKVIDNEVLGADDTHLMYWLTDGLTNGGSLFYECSTITSFLSGLSSLKSSYKMFYYCANLTTFTIDLPSLTYGEAMFWMCYNLDTFTSDLPSLTNGSSMFAGCYKLTAFTSDLPSLTNGTNMFGGCKLSATSVANIVHTLPTHESSGTITIGIGCDDTEADQLLFAQECDCETWQELLDDFSAKNWTVEFQCKGRPTEATTYNMRRGETLPIYAKLEEVIMPTDEKEHKPHYTYTSADGSKFYNINYFHSTNGSTDGYDVFSSLEEAIEAYNVTPKN